MNIRAVIGLIGLLFCISTVNAQSDTVFFSTELSLKVSALDYIKAKSDLKRLINQYPVNIKEQNESEQTSTVTFTTDEKTFYILKDSLSALGEILLQNLNTSNQKITMDELAMEIRFLTQKLQHYNDFLQTLDPKSEAYLSVWTQKMLIESDLFEKNKALQTDLKKNQPFLFAFTLVQEILPARKQRLTFVNMPGLEYAYFLVENPKLGLTSGAYQGGSLKYLFTQGKSYLGAGIFKSIEPIRNDSTTFSDLFVVNFGQDFFSRYLGQGGRKYLNLYSGYTLGYMLATGSTSKLNVFYISPSIGIEWFKSRHILVDTKGAYLIPFQENKNLRGLMISASFNFVF